MENNEESIIELRTRIGDLRDKIIIFENRVYDKLYQYEDRF